MHTREFDTDKGIIAIHYNGDYSGDIQIVVGETTGFTTPGMVGVVIPFEVLANFVAGAVRDKRMERLENLAWFYLLGFDNEAP
jgi:hypothetical protein